jgi:hypothetical protein
MQPGALAFLESKMRTFSLFELGDHPPGAVESGNILSIPQRHRLNIIETIKKSFCFRNIAEPTF